MEERQQVDFFLGWKECPVFTNHVNVCLGLVVHWAAKVDFKYQVNTFEILFLSLSGKSFGRVNAFRCTGKLRPVSNRLWLVILMFEASWVKSTIYW